MNNLKQSTIEKAYQFALDNRDILDISMRSFKDKKEFTTVKDLIDGEYNIFIHIIIDKDQLSKIRKDLQDALNTTDMKYGNMISVYNIVKSDSVKLIFGYNAKNGLSDLYYRKIDTPFYPSHILSKKNWAKLLEILCNKHNSAMILKNWAELLENDKLKELAEIFLEN